MVNECVSRWLCWLGGQPSFQIHGRGRAEEDWRTISVYATHRRNAESRWPLCRGTCITWTSEVIAVGWDFALELVREQMTEPASRQRPVEVSGGRLQNLMGRADAGAPGFPTVSEVLAHECGHTWQALRFRAAYLPIGARSLSSGKGRTSGTASRTRQANRGYSAASSLAPSVSD